MIHGERERKREKERERERERERKMSRAWRIYMVAHGKREKKIKKKRGKNALKMHYSLSRGRKNVPRQPAGYFRNTLRRMQANPPVGGINAILSRQVV
jgi:phage/plasmid-associated DNA primase